MKEVTVFDADKNEEVSDVGEVGDTTTSLDSNSGLRGARVAKVDEGEKNNNIKFYGQHSDERILYEVHPHPMSMYLGMGKVVLVALMLGLVFYMVGATVPRLEGKIEPLGFWLGLGVLIIGNWLVWKAEKDNIGFITDRRIVRFHSSTWFTTNSRALSWDEAVKVKTYSPNFILRLMNIGTVVVHAKTTIVQMNDTPQSKNFMTDDDVELDDVHYYRDLGNYVDKIMYLYKKNSPELERMKPFVAKPKGKRD